MTVSVSLSFGADDLKLLMSRRDPPCVSIYLPTHRRKTEGRSDAILYRNLCREVEKILQRDISAAAARDIGGRLRELDREEFWEDGKRSDGLAVFSSAGFISAFWLPGQFPGALEVVGASFHTKPLIRFLQSNSFSYYLLSLNTHRVALYEGFGEALVEVPLKGVPRSLEEMPSDLGENHQAARQKSGDRLHYGQGGPKEHLKTDLERFFREVAKELWKNHLRGSPKPLILAALGQHQPLFRKVAQIPTLLEAGIVVDPHKMSPEALRTESRRVLEPEIDRRIAKAKEELGLALSRGHGSDSLKDIARAVIQGRVKLLFVESGRRVWGLLDTETGEIMPGDTAKNAYDVDLLDELAEYTIVRGGEVFVLKKDVMPSIHGIAAIFRF